MITEAILNGLFVVADFFLGFLPEISLSVNTSVWGAAGDVLSMVCYLLPLKHLVAVVTIICTLGAFRIIVAFIRFILSVIPGF